MAHIQISSVQNSQLAPISIGHPIHFGPHPLLSGENFHAIWQLLRCRHCSFRRLYHKLAVRECKNNSSHITPCFHSLCRAIKAVLQGLCLNRRCSTKFVVTSSHASVFPPGYAMPSDYVTVTRTSVSIRNGFVVCPSHGRELFDLLYCNESDESCLSEDGVKEFGKAPTSFRNQLFIPRGHSLFFRSILANEVSSDDSTDEEDGHMLTAAPNKHSTVRIVSVSSQRVLDAVHATIHNGNSKSIKMHSWNNDLPLADLKCCHDRVIEANNKWLSFYGSFEDGPCEKRTDRTVPTKHTETKRHAHFPTNNPISSVHRMFRYAIASSLERRDRVWETAAQHRIFSRYCRLVSSGHDPCTASELAERSSEEDDVDVDRKDTCSTSIITETVVPLTNTVPKSKRKKRRKRRKKTPKNPEVPANSDGLWTVKSNDYNHPLSIFFSSPIPCQSGGPAPF